MYNKLCYVLSLCLCATLLPTTVLAVGSYGANLASDAYQSSINPFYASGYGGSSTDGYDGECTWYAWGRAYEKLGVALPCRGHANSWTEEAADAGYSTGSEARGNSIMVEHYEGTGHVFFVEYVENGYAYVSEGNWNGYYHEDTINLSTMRRDSWQSHAMGPIDYIYLGSNPIPTSTPSQNPTNVKVTTNKSSYQPGETVTISVTGNNFNWFSISISKNGETVFENYDYNKSSISYTAGNPGTYQVTVSACKDWEHYTDAQCSFTVATPSASVSFTPWENGNYTYIGETDAAVGMTVSVSNGTLSYVGMALYNASGTKLAEGGEGNDYIGPYYFKINEELHYTMTPGTTYKYKFFATVSGKTYWSSEQSFKTKGSAPVNYAVSLNQSSLSLTVGKSASLSATVSPAGTAVAWSSNNPSVATVSNGKVTAVGAGTATITATAGGKSATCTVTVTAANVAVTGVTLSQSTLTLKLGDNATLTATVTPTNATDKTISWVSSDPSIAAARNGEVFSVGVGTATITATAGGKSATCAVTVTASTVAVTGITLSQSRLTMKTGDNAFLIATVSPSNATNAVIAWSSSNPSVATVSGGAVTAVGAGTATITASAGSKSATCAVSVTQEQKAGLQIGTGSLSSASVGSAYSQKLIANSTGSVTWSVSSGSLPSGLALSSDGIISGTPTAAGTYNFTVTATNSEGTDSKLYSLVVSGDTTQIKKDVHFERKNVYYQDQFTDVKANQWFTDTVASAFELGLMKGNSATTFNPYGDVTVAEAITMAARVHSINVTGTERFVQTGNWYQVYLDYAYQNGIISYAYYNSDVTQKATRAQFAEIFAESLPSENLSAINQIADNAVPDVNMSQSYANSVYTLYRAGILTGSDALGHFNPQTYITRAEAATILSRMAESNNRVSFSLGN